ncbi:hypothetical protein MBLNU457_g0929t2 [Dothideomycetes sp. NU457]
MADEREEATDATPIKAVSSLRSKFENLGQEKQTSSAPRSNSLHPSAQDARAPKPAATPPRTSMDTARPLGASPFGLGIDGVSVNNPQPRIRKSPVTEQRPISMVDLPDRTPRLPAVTVDSPRSPPKALSPRLAALSNPRSPQLSGRLSSTGPSPNRTNARTSFDSAVTTPDSLQPLSALSQAGKSPSPGKGPPPVNRSGKPKISPTLLAKPNTSTDNLSMNLSDSVVSPFNTPPSSSDNLPSEFGMSPPAISQRTKPRLGSQASLDRQSYFNSPPTHHSIRERRQETEIKPISRAATLPVQAEQRHRALDGSRDQPGLKLLPNRIPASGRTSPTRQRQVSTPVSDSMSSLSTIDTGFAPPPKRAQSSASALSQGFNRSIPLKAHERSIPPSPTRKVSPPAPPAPRRSIDTRRPAIPARNSFESRQEIAASANGHSRADDREDPPADFGGPTQAPGDYPDASRANRRKPHFRQRPYEIATEYDTKLCAVCGDYVCTTGYVTRVWNIRTGELLVSLGHGESVKVTAIAWKPASDVSEEGKRLWLGTSFGDMLELDIPSKQVVDKRSNAHARAEIIRIYRYASQLWSLDDSGRLQVWRPGPDGTSSLSGSYNTFSVPRGHTASVTVGECLWIATGKDIHVFNPCAGSDGSFRVLPRPLSQDTAGDITSATTISGRPNEVYFGHSDGKVSVYDKSTYKCLGVHNVSTYKMSTIAGVGGYLWAGYNNGMAYVYDTSTPSWLVKKDWKAHNNTIASLVVDQSSVWKSGRLQVITLGTDNKIAIWDGMLQQDWLEARMQERDEDYCTFQEITAAVVTWNAGASKPNYLRNDSRDNVFLRDFLTSQRPPDILVFGFQELVDLEDKKQTAKSLFNRKRKDPAEQEHVGHQYRAWRDHLVRSIDEFMPADQNYSLLHTSSMVGLFSCIFVKSSLRSRISNVNTAEVKRGLNGLHGNKGALMIRMVLDDSSLCFINCHLAAGQTQTMNRNNDIASILESENLPPMAGQTETFTGGGDGSMILDHEICILNGDLNYRIDAMTRDNVVRSVRDNNLTKLLDRDQLLLSKKRNPGHRIRLFDEMPITFAPTYKYNVGTDDYDTSEKKRSPAWCDRILYRGIGRVKCADYRRWELRLSDHRPVSGQFKIRIKRVDPTKRETVWTKTGAEYERYRAKVEHEIQ